MERDDLTYLLQDKIEGIRDKRNRLIIVCGIDKDFKEICDSLNFECINLNQQLSEKLKKESKSKRPRVIASVLKKYISQFESEVIAINHYEILFLQELQQDPIRLFEDLSKDKVIIINWLGKYEEGCLFYAEPWHSEFREYTCIDAEIIHIQN